MSCSSACELNIGDLWLVTCQFPDDLPPDNACVTPSTSRATAELWAVGHAHGHNDAPGGCSIALGLRTRELVLPGVLLPLRLCRDLEASMSHDERSQHVRLLPDPKGKLLTTLLDSNFLALPIIRLFSCLKSRQASQHVVHSPVASLQGHACILERIEPFC